MSGKRFLRRVAGRIHGELRSALIGAIPNVRLKWLEGLRPVPFDELGHLPGVYAQAFRIEPVEHEAVLRRIFPQWRDYFDNPFYKKLLEFHFSYKILDIQPSDTYMDAAGGFYTYVDKIQAARRILQDRVIKRDLGEAMEEMGVETVESFADTIPFPDSSIDKVSCHHSFEHFWGEGDIRFIKELQRLLAPGGRACIVPILISGKYYEIVDGFRVPKGDPLALRVFDPTSPLPGGRFSGGLARVYDLKAFTRRILSAIDRDAFCVSIYELRMNSKPLPDADLVCHRTDPQVDFPYRALVLNRLR